MPILVKPLLVYRHAGVENRIEFLAIRPVEIPLHEHFDLLGHSMGGMTVLAYARQHPEQFGSRIRGVFLLATSAGDLVAGGLAGLVARVGKRLGLLPLWLWWLRVLAPLLQRLNRPGTRLGRAMIRRYLFGSDDADPATVTLVQDLLEQAPLTISAAFYPTSTVTGTVRRTRSAAVSSWARKVG